MSDGNIIRSKNHTVTIEKGSKNAKGRSAHMEEWLDPVEGAPEAHEEDKIFQSNVQSNPGSPFELSTSSDPQNQGVRTAAQKMADLDKITEIANARDSASREQMEPAMG